MVLYVCTHKHARVQNCNVVYLQATSNRSHASDDQNRICAFVQSNALELWRNKHYIPGFPAWRMLPFATHEAYSADEIMLSSQRWLAGTFPCLYPHQRPHIFLGL